MKKYNSIKNNSNKCPFGLPIPFGCKCAGDHINNMVPINSLKDDVSEDEKEMIANANVKLLGTNLLRTSEQPYKCRYVGNIIEKQDAVECNYDDSAPGEGPGKALRPAPFYSKIFNGPISGLLTCPVGYYSDYNTVKNDYYGLFSLQGSDKSEDINKFSEHIKEEEDSANKKE